MSNFLLEKLDKTTRIMSKKHELTEELINLIESGDDLNNFISILQKRGIEKLLEGELDSHLNYDKHEISSNTNYRNGYQKKRLRSSMGEIDINVPRDRDGSFNPILVPKRKNMLEGVENIIVSLYAKGMSTGDIEEQIEDIYGIDVSRSTISRITDRITEDIFEWQNRELDPVYLMVWFDGIVFKVREDSQVVNKTIYIALGLRSNGKREVLGIWVGRNESASFWMGVMTDIKARGVEDILISVTDNLAGFSSTINSVFPRSTTQVCIVHQIRNASKHVVWKDRKEFSKDMKSIYTAPNMQIAEAALDSFTDKWEKKYPYAIKSWQNNWNELMAFIDFPLEIRRIMYTTNIIENLNGKIRKYTSNKLSFPTDKAVTKSVYLAIREVTKRWTRAIPNWSLIINQFLAIFEDRIKLHE